MIIKAFQGGYDKNFCYVAHCKKTNHAAIIDPSVEINPIIEYLTMNDLVLDKIIISHTHGDHIFYLKDFINIYPNISVYGHSKPKKTFKKVNYHGVDNNEIFSIGDNIITALETPGHYPDSVCYWSKNQKIVFTGDTIFVGRTGRVKSAGSDIKKLYESVYDILLKLPSDTVIYPGHNYGYSSTISIKENINLSSFFQCKNLDEFIKIMDDFEKNR